MARSRFWSSGVPFVWGTSAMVILTLLLLAGLIGVIVQKGLAHFWPEPLEQIKLTSGESYLGQVTERQGSDDDAHTARAKYWIGNRDVYGLDFKWIDDSALVSRWCPDSAAVFERLTNGDLFGFLVGLRTEGGSSELHAESLYDEFQRARQRARHTSEKVASREERISDLYRPLTDLERKLAGTKRQPDGARRRELERKVDSARSAIEAVSAGIHAEIDELRALNAKRQATIRLADGRTLDVPLADIVRAWHPNQMSFGARVSHYGASLWTFLSEWPREANTGGGIFPAIYGTMLMVLLMTIAVVPLGVVAALYLHEYAGDSWFVRSVRLAVSNLAGVPSIVFGVFGLGFFIYFVGAGVDRAFFSEYLPSPTFGTGGILWASLTLALLTVPVVIVATEEGLAAVPRAYREGALALGATKFQTIRKIVIPYAMPGILTGVILAVSRGAGEVAPLMLTGVVPAVSDNPLDATFPFLHLERKFMHLGFHIYDVGFQSPNVEAVKPLVYSTTLVLILLVVLMNALAIILRTRLRRRARGANV